MVLQHFVKSLWLEGRNFDISSKYSRCLSQFAHYSWLQAVNSCGIGVAIDLKYKVVSLYLWCGISCFCDGTLAIVKLQ